MKAHLLYRDRDLDLDRKPPWNAEALAQDLELDTLVAAMAQKDDFLFKVARTALFAAMESDVEAILYRQAVLKDCLANAERVKEIYAITLESIEREKKAHWGGFFADYPTAILGRSIAVIQAFLGLLRRLRQMAEEEAPHFKSEAFTAFWQMLREELTDDYFALVEDHLKQLKFRNGVLVSADFGPGARAVDYVLREPPRTGKWYDWFFGDKRESYTLTLHPRDEAGFQELSEMRDRGVSLVANALAQSADHMQSFFQMLRRELAFYIGCMNVRDALAGKGEPLCLPLPSAFEERKLTCRGLYDVSLALSIEQRVVGNDLDADGKSLVMITGANRGGKSTFLRGMGLAQLMMQAGMWAPAEAFSASVCDGVFTHYKREEDASMESGKLDEELRRMSEIADHLTKHPLVLFNEAFAATTEREGSEIARQVTQALLDQGCRVFFVTHLSDFAISMFEKHLANAIYLRAERGEEGARPFKLVEGQPLETSYGADLYQRIFEGREDRLSATDAKRPLVPADVV